MKVGIYDDNVNDPKIKNWLGQIVTITVQTSGEKYKYFKVFQTKNVENYYIANTIIEVLKRL